MNVNESPENAPEAPAMAAAAGTVSDTGAGHGTHGGGLRRAAAVAVGHKKQGVPPVAGRPPHPGALVWVDCTAEVCKLARGGMTVAEIADAAGVSRSQVESALSLGGVRRPRVPHGKVGPRKFDRGAVRAAHAAGETRNAIAARLGISVSSVSLSVNEVTP